MNHTFLPHIHHRRLAVLLQQQPSPLDPLLESFDMLKTITVHTLNKRVSPADMARLAVLPSLVVTEGNQSAFQLALENIKRVGPAPRARKLVLNLLGALACVDPLSGVLLEKARVFLMVTYSNHPDHKNDSDFLRQSFGRVWYQIAPSPQPKKPLDFAMGVESRPPSETSAKQLEDSLRRYTDSSPPDQREERMLVAKQIRRALSNTYRPFTLYITHFKTITTLPDGIDLGLNIHISRCPNFAYFPDNVNAVGDLSIAWCPSFVHFPSDLRPLGTITIVGCASLTHFPEGFCPGGDVRVVRCPNFVQIPQSMFLMSEQTCISLIETSVTAAMVHTITQQIAMPGYNGPSFELSAGHHRPSVWQMPYRSEVGVSAQDLPGLFSLFGQRRDHPVWQFAIAEAETDERWDGFAWFLARLFNEIPRPDGQLPRELKQHLFAALSLMESEFTQTQSHPSSRKFIPTILQCAKRGTGAYRDDVHVGYVLLQLHTQKAMATIPEKRGVLDQYIKTMEKCIGFVSDLNLSRVVYDTHSQECVRFSIANSHDGDTTYVISMHDPVTDLTVTNADVSLDLTVSMACEQFVCIRHQTEPNRFRIIRSGNEVADALFLAYRLISDVHKPDLLFQSGHTLRDPAVRNAALQLINREVGQVHWIASLFPFSTMDLTLRFRELF